MKQNDYYVEHQKYSISQLRNSPNYLNIVETSAYFDNQLQEIIQKLLDSIDIDYAEGFLLDYLAWLVGTSREYFDISDYFCLNRADVNVSKYIYFQNADIQTGSLQDVKFRQRIKAKAYANHSRCTREDNIFVIKNMTFADKVIIENVAPLMLDITLVGSNVLITENSRADIESVLGQGVGIRNLEVDDGTE